MNPVEMWPQENPERRLSRRTGHRWECQQRLVTSGVSREQAVWGEPPSALRLRPDTAQRDHAQGCGVFLSVLYNKLDHGLTKSIYWIYKC